MIEFYLEACDQRHSDSRVKQLEYQFGRRLAGCGEKQERPSSRKYAPLIFCNVTARGK